MVIVEGRRPLCWSCKQLWHFSRSCPQTTKMSTATSVTATTDPGKNKEGWTKVVQTGEKPKNKIPTEATITTTTDTTVKPTTRETATTENKQTIPPPDKNKKKKRGKKHQPEEHPEAMETSTNLKRNHPQQNKLHPHQTNHLNLTSPLHYPPSHP